MFSPALFSLLCRLTAGLSIVREELSAVLSYGKLPSGQSFGNTVNPALCLIEMNLNQRIVLLS